MDPEKPCLSTPLLSKTGARVPGLSLVVSFLGELRQAMLRSQYQLTHRMLTKGQTLC